jgi:hypothetical protein
MSPKIDDVDRNPRTPKQWQEAVNAAQFLLPEPPDSATLHGIADTDTVIRYALASGAKVKIQRCRAILECGAKLGYHPQPTDQLWRTRSIRKLADPCWLLKEIAEEGSAQRGNARKAKP